MTTLRKAAKKALEALDRSDYFGWQSNIPIIKSLREALAQPEPEPVADTESDVLTATYMLGLHAGKKAATKRKPLTDEEIDKVTDAQWAQNNHKPIYAAHRAYARAIEQAHGIVGEQ